MMTATATATARTQTQTQTQTTMPPRYARSGDRCSNDATTTAADGTVLPGGNYASNSFYVNGRYRLAAHRQRYTPWIGGGLIYTQEIDLDSEGDTLERSFSDAGAVGFQLLTGADVDLTERLYASGELRYASRTGLELSGEGDAGRVTGLDYETVTLGLGLGLRFGARGASVNACDSPARRTLED